MTASLPPALIMAMGAFLVPFLGGRLKQAYMLLLPLAALVMVHSLPEGTYATLSFWDYDLILLKVDRLSRVFGYIFSIMGCIGVLFALKVDDDLQHVAALVYAGSSLGVTFAGDFFTLYFFWELMAVGSTFVILARRTPEARAAAYRYVLVHLAGGLFMLGGILLRLMETGSLAVEHIQLSGLSSWLIFIGIAVNGVVFPLHSWLKDAYPTATATGAVFLSAFTTKSAVYVMARTFAGTEILIYLGAFMTFFPVFFAVLENDIRGVLSYSLINQVGFMMCGIGLGTELALNGAVSHAFCHILYKALLFMSAGAVLQQTGKIRCTDLGGLYKYMPLTCIFCMVGAASISAFPLFSGFISKSMIVSEAGYQHLILVWLALQFASVGVLEHAGIKVPFFMFFGHDSGLRPKEAPVNQLLAMGITAFLCIFLGTYPAPLYSILPFPVNYVPYTGGHVVSQLQLLLFGALAFALLMFSGFYPAEMRCINLDTDWFYRKAARLGYAICDKVLNGINQVADRLVAQGLSAWLAAVFQKAVAGVALAVLVPVWKISGRGGSELESKQRQTALDLENGTTPVGLGAAAAVVVLLILFAFSR